MGTESIEASFLSIFALISFFIFLIISKLSQKIKNGVLLDNDLNKPQAFHNFPIVRSGGLGTIISLCIFFYFYYLLYSEILYEYIFISFAMFIVGFLDDLKIRIQPSKRLLLMIFLLFLLIHFLPIRILNIDIIFLTGLLKVNIFSSIFVLLCFLFIINGANLIDGFNGLLVINLIIINIILTYINIDNANLEFSYLLISQIIILFSFLLFNFPNAKMFFGDSGAYLMGSLVGLNSILTNNLNPNISSFFFCTLLFYLFFEVFFSFFRKLLQKKSPIHPDKKHLHMLSYYKILSIFGKNKANYFNSIFINICYFVLIIPGIYFINDPVLSRAWFFILLLIYMVAYYRLYHLTKN